MPNWEISFSLPQNILFYGNRKVCMLAVKIVLKPISTRKFKNKKLKTEMNCVGIFKWVWVTERL